VLLLMRISGNFNGAELQVISAHRAVDGVVTSEHSQHGKGTASDIRIAGVDVELLAQAAHEQGARGVGIYTRSRFVHVDVREEHFAWRSLDEGEGEGEGEEEGEGEGEGDDGRSLADQNDMDHENTEDTAPAAAVEIEAEDVAADAQRKVQPAETGYQEETLEGKTLSGL
jgi:hypothetical protein